MSSLIGTSILLVDAAGDMPVTTGEWLVVVDTAKAAFAMTLQVGTLSGKLTFVKGNATALDFTLWLPSGVTANGEAGPFVLSNIGDTLRLEPDGANYRVLNPSITVP